MPRNKLHLLVDILAYLAMACLAGTGLLMLYRLPPGSGSRAILGYTRHQWGTVHFYIALGLIALVALHVILHWAWVTNMFGALTRPKGQRKAGAGAGGALVLAVLGLVAVGVLAAPWLLPVGQGVGHGHEGGGGKQRRGGRDACDTCEGTCPTTVTPAGKGKGHEPGEEYGHGGIRGSTTLAEAAAEAGVPFERLLAELKLPANTSPVETLGRLRQQHGFTMQDVRAVIARLKQAKADKKP